MKKGVSASKAKSKAIKKTVPAYSPEQSDEEDKKYEATDENLLGLGTED